MLHEPAQSHDDSDKHAVTFKMQLGLWMFWVHRFLCRFCCGERGLAVEHGTAGVHINLAVVYGLG